MNNAIFLLNGQIVNPVKDWGSIEVLATWNENGGEANISMEEFTFVNENAQTIREYIADGMTGGLGIFEGIPFKINIQDGQSLNVFDGILDLNDFEEISPVEVRCKIKKLDGLNQLSDRASGITMQFLYEEGFLTESDFVKIPYIKEEPLKESATELALLSLTIFLFIKELNDLSEELIKELGINAPAHTVGGISGPAAGAYYTTATIVVNIIYAALLLIQLTSLILDLIEILFPPIRCYMGSKLKHLLEKTLGYIGYQYSSSIVELENLYILPSKNDEGKLFIASQSGLVGYPDSIDYGFTISELITLVNNLFDARIKIIGNTVFQESLINDNFWIGQTQFQIPDVENEKKLYNTNDLKARKIFRYETDLADYWTIIRYLGTGYETVTTPITIGDSKRVLIKGFDETIIPYALGDVKRGLNPVEGFVKIMAGAIDAVINLVGGNGNNKAKILARTEMLHLTGDSLTVGKLLYLTEGAGGKLLMKEDRIKIEAQTLVNKYHYNNSFVLNNYRGQKKLISELKIPFGFSNFIQVLGNSYCTDQQGNIVKIEELKWNFGNDFALISGWIRSPYTKNLTEKSFLGLENQT
jgi:hypothetical protein